MNNIDLFLMGFQNLWRRKLRTFLTVLGVIIGASSIIIMLSLGFGMTASFENMISEWGDLTTITVRQEWGGESMPGKKIPKRDDKAIANFKALSNVAAVTPVLSVSGTLTAGRYQAWTTMYGIDPATMEDFGYEVSDGRLLNGGDKLAIVSGWEMKNYFRDPKSKVYREVTVDLMKDKITFALEGDYAPPGSAESKPPKEYSLKSVGVFKEGNYDTSYGTYMAIDELQKIVKENERSQRNQQANKKSKEYDEIKIKVNDIDNVAAVQEVIKELGFYATSYNDQLDSFKEQALVIQAVLGGIGAISLLVAAIGITNTMIMSIYERTKEIGVMKVIGASIKDIKRLFLFESALIGLVGGVFGVAVSYLISYLMNHFGAQFMGEMMGNGSKISIIPIWLALASMAFSAFIGVLSGYFPAKRAMNLSALEAIRTE